MMYIFTIKAFNAFGQTKTLKIKAENFGLAQYVLAQEGFYAEDKDVLKVEKASFFSKLKKLNFNNIFLRVSPKELQRFIKLLAGSLCRGKSFKGTLQFIIENEDSKSLKKLLQAMLSRLERPFSSQVEIFADFPHYFDEEFLGIIEAGESSSNLGEYLMDYVYEKKKQYKFTQNFKNILLKRSLTFFMVVMVGIAVVAFVIPQFEALFGESLQMPWAMDILLNISEFILDYGLYISLFILGFIIIFTYFIFYHPRLRWRWHNFLLNFPFLGRTLRTYYTAQFSYFLSTLLTKNVDILKSMQIIIKQTKNVCMIKTYQNLVTSMRSGDDLFSAILKEAKAGRHYMIPSIVQAAKVGSETASLGVTLMDVRNDLEELLHMRFQHSIKAFSAIFYSFIILIALFMAYAIGSAIIAFYDNAQNLI